MNNDALTVGLATLAYVAVFGFLAWRLARRPMSEATKIPSLQFAIFWGGLGVSSLPGGVLSLVAAFHTPSLGLAEAFETYNVVAACVALWGLVGYLLFIYTGKGHLFWLTMLYLAEFAFLIYYFAASDASSVTVDAGTVNLVYSTPVGGVLLVIPVVVLVLPEIALTIAYFSLIFRTHDPPVRYRITLIGLALLAWFGFSIFLGAATFGGGGVGTAVSRLVGVAPAVFVWLAYFPPEKIRRRFGLDGTPSAAPGA